MNILFSNYGAFINEFMKLIKSDDADNVNNINNIVSVVNKFYSRKNTTDLEILYFMETVKSIKDTVARNILVVLRTCIIDMIDTYIYTQLNLTYNCTKSICAGTKSPKELVEIANIMCITLKTFFHVSMKFKFLDEVKEHYNQNILWNSLYNSLIECEPLDSINAKIKIICDSYPILSNDNVINHLGITINNNTMYLVNISYILWLKDKLNIDIYKYIYETYSEIQRN